STRWYFVDEEGVEELVKSLITRNRPPVDLEQDYKDAAVIMREVLEAKKGVEYTGLSGSWS
ncbi:MAG: hypothetical protein JZU65_13560, partial [Chlorobium sp.]|nr:hypothetical protein [Chlorobium sp.]